MDSDARSWLRDTALAVALAAGFLTFTGYMRLQAKYNQWVVPFELTSVSVHAYMLASLLPLIAPLFLFVLLYFISYWWGHNVGLDRLRVNLLGLTVITATLTFWSRLTFVIPLDGWVPPLFPYFRLNAATAGLLVMLLFVLAGPIVVAQKPKDGPMKDWYAPLLGAGRHGIPGLLSLLFLFWSLAASFSGTLEAEATLDGCVVSTLATLQPDPTGRENHTYVYLTHLDGLHYLRDVSVQETHAVPDGTTTLRLTLRPADSGLC